MPTTRRAFFKIIAGLPLAATSCRPAEASLPAPTPQTLSILILED